MKTERSDSISHAIENSIKTYLNNLEGCEPQQLYDLVLSQVEKPLLKTILAEANGNQSAAARWLGVSRNTLRKMIAKYNLFDTGFISK